VCRDCALVSFYPRFGDLYQSINWTENRPPGQYAYRFAGKYKTLSLGIYPDVPLERARSRHEFARNLLARGIDPSALKAALGKHIFVVTMREWEIARGEMSAPIRGVHDLEPMRANQRCPTVRGQGSPQDDGCP
jgi:hypothetical protein